MLVLVGLPTHRVDERDTFRSSTDHHRVVGDLRAPVGSVTERR